MEPEGMKWANFEQLRHRYYYGTRAPWAAEMIENFSILQSQEARYIDRDMPDLVTILGQEENAQKHRSRQAINDLLAYYSIIEVASLAGSVPEPLPPKFERSNLAALHNRDIAAYCERHERLLPLLLKSRLRGEPPVSAKRKLSGEEMEYFSAFLDVNAIIENDPEVERFFQYLSGEEWGGYDLNDLISLTRRPAELLRRLAKNPDEEGSDGLDMALHGFRSFLIFSHRLDSLLHSCSDDPLLRSAFWHFHSSLFVTLAQDIRTCMDRVLNNLSDWTETAKAKIILVETPSGLSLEESLESLEEFQWTIWRLTSDLYRQPLLNATGFETPSAIYPEPPLPTQSPWTARFSTISSDVDEEEPPSVQTLREEREEEDEEPPSPPEPPLPSHPRRKAR